MNETIEPRRNHKNDRRSNSEEKRKRISKSLGSANAPPRNVHVGDWKEMLQLVQRHNSIDPTTDNGSECDSEHSRIRAPTTNSLDQNYWVQTNFWKRQCAEFIPMARDPNKCGCGRHRDQHSKIALQVYHENNIGRREYKWMISRHTCTLPTDAFGTIEFQGGPHPHKANYLRLSFDSDPSQIMDLFEKVWQISPPKLIITVHGGISNFDLQPKLARVFRKGLLKAAKTTGAWIITSGINAGVVRHVAAALEGAMSSSSKSRPRITCIGIAPWGLLKKREDFVGQDKVVQYHPSSFSPKGRFAVLNNRHSYYLLVDNGTVGRYGADIILRRQLEGYIVQKQKLDGGERSVPVVCVLLEGGSGAVRTVNDYVTNEPRIPVVVCDGSGRAADLLAFAQQYFTEKGDLPENITKQLHLLIKTVFDYDDQNADQFLLDIISCVRQKQLLTVFRLGEDQTEDFDHAILTALLKGNNLKPHEQFSLALAWNRVDIARTDVMMENDWPPGSLNSAMMEALIHHRVDFVRLLLENGVSMQKFLTIERLEQLYNTEYGPQNTLFYIVRDVVKMGKNYRYTLPHIGLAIEKLMGNGFRSYYTSVKFHHIYSDYRRKRAMKQKMAHFSATLNNLDYFEGPLSVIASGMGINTTDGERPMMNGTNPLSFFGRKPGHRQNLSANMSFMTPPQTLRERPVGIEMDASEEDEHGFHFQYPFSELLLWAILTKRQDMALCMWEHGEEAMAKALIACRLYKSLAKEAAEDYLEVEICEELRKYADEFRHLSLELLDTCYKHDDAQTLQLLTYELAYWGHETCLSLAVIVNNKAFLAHPCCQILLADLWHGGLRIRSNSNFKVVLGLLCFPTIFLLEFKSHEELKKQPQTLAEHEDELNQEHEGEEMSDFSVSSDSESSEEENFGGGVHDRRKSTGSILFNSLARFNRKSSKKRKTDLIKEEREKSNSVSVVEMSVPHEVRNRTRSAVSFKNETIPIQNGKSVSVNSTAEEIPRETKKASMTSRGHRNTVSSVVRKSTIEDTPPKQLQKLTLQNRYSKKQLRIRRKLYEFFAAPVTTFWSWFLSYLVFILIFTYVLLVRTPDTILFHEWYIYFYVLASLFDMIRKLFMSEPRRFREKVNYFFKNYWHGLTTFAILSFLFGATCRILDDDYNPVGRCVMAISGIFWALKLLDFLSIHPKFGPLVTMAGKMVVRMTYVVLMLALSMFAFGLARQSIYFPNEEWDWMLIRNIWYKPYFMFYGEVYAGEIDICNDKIWDGHLEQGVTLAQFRENFTDPIDCVPGHWIPPFLMTIFLLITDVLLMSLLLAVFNHTYDEVNAISQQIWLFQRYRQVMEFESTPFLPPPFTLIYHVYMIVKYLEHFCSSCIKGKPRKKLFDFTLKLFLTPDRVEKLHDFEEECMDEYARHKEYERNISSEERLHRTAERTDMLLVRMNDLITKETALKSDVGVLEERIDEIETKQVEILDYLKQMTVTFSTNLNALHNIPKTEEKSRENTTSESLSLPTFKVMTESCENCGRLRLDSSRRTSLLSLTKDPALSASFRRRRRNDEYTSITDTIDIDQVINPTQISPKPRRTVDELDYDEYELDSESSIEHEVPSSNSKEFQISRAYLFNDHYADSPGLNLSEKD